MVVDTYFGRDYNRWSYAYPWAIGISTLFGPVSARRADPGVLAISNLNSFLLMIQQGQFATADGGEVIYSVFGDSAFNLGMQCILGYYRSFQAGGELSDSEKKCNSAFDMSPEVHCNLCNHCYTLVHA
jgi:hypothetical protein